MKIIFLGTNGWYSTKTGNTICTLVDTRNYYIVFDAGDGIYKLNKYAKKNKPIYLFLSHVHLDHIIGFHLLNALNYRGKFHIVLKKSDREKLENIINHPYTKSLKDQNFSVIIHELPEKKSNTPFPVTHKKLFHIDNSTGFRIEVDGKKITYCCDTGKCKNDFILSKDADLLIHECSFNNNASAIGKWGHSNSIYAAGLARKARVKKLALTHFSPNEHVSMKDREKAGQVAKKIFKNTFTARDNMIINI